MFRRMALAKYTHARTHINQLEHIVPERLASRQKKRVWFVKYFEKNTFYHNVRRQKTERRQKEG